MSARLAVRDEPQPGNVDGREVDLSVRRSSGDRQTDIRYDRPLEPQVTLYRLSVVLVDLQCTTADSTPCRHGRSRTVSVAPVRPSWSGMLATRDSRALPSFAGADPVLPEPDGQHRE
jgi:hypothetical protein